MNYELIFGSMKTLITVLASFVLIKYFIYLTLVPFYSVQKAYREFRLQRMVKKGILPKTYEPLVSVIIPAWNEAVGIITTIKSVLANKYQKVEIIVINDGSTDNTNEIMKNFLKTHGEKSKDGKKIKYFEKKNGGKGTALNFGIQNSSGEIVLTMDADSAHHPMAIMNLVKYFKDPAVDAVVGNVKVANARSLVGLIQKLEYIFGFHFKGVHSLFNAEYIFGGACAAFRRSTTFDNIGLFDVENKTEDIEYSMRTKSVGLNSQYADDVITYTEGANSLKGLYNQRLRWKKGRIDTFVKYRHLFFSTKPGHSKFLSFIVLPYAVLGEIQMFFEPMLFTLIWTYTFISGDFLSIGISSLFIFFTYLSVAFSERTLGSLIILLLFPAFWLLFYILVGVEFLSLLKAVEMVFSGKDVIWQKWSREGIEGNEAELDLALNSFNTINKNR